MRSLSVLTTIFFTVSLFLVSTIAIAQAQNTAETHSDAEMYSLVQTIEAAAGEQVFTRIESQADIAALSAIDRELLLTDVLDMKRNVDRAAAMDGFSEPAKCFDYYTFGSVDAPIHAKTTNPAAGTTAEFTVNLTNNNPYPVVDANVYIKLFRARPAGEQSAQLAHLVDQFQAIEGVTIPANATRERTFTYDIPSSLPSGEYNVVTFVSTAQRYNLLGLPFTDDVVGDSTTLTITGDQAGMVRWNRDQVLVDLKQHHFASFIPEVSPTQPVRVIAPIYNELDTPINGQLTWKVYHWDQQNEANLITTETRPISIAAGDSISASYTLEDIDHAVYVVVGEVEHNGVTSLINVRFARTDVSEIRLNYPGVLSYPLVEGEENTLFSCLHSASSFDLVPDSRLELSLLDAQGEEFYSYTYEGPVSSDMMGVAKTFVPKRSHDTFTLKAALYQNDTLVEDVSFVYDCTELTAGPCDSVRGEKTGQGEKTGLFGLGESGTRTPIILVGILVLLGVLGLAIWRLFLRKKTSSADYPIASLLLMGILGTALLIPGAVQAQVTNNKPAQTGYGTSITAGDTYNGGLSRRANAYVTEDTRVNNALSNPHATVHYHADIFNETNGGNLVPGDAVAVGDVLRFTPRLGSIDWFGTGGYADSPLGVWYDQAAFPKSLLSILGKREGKAGNNRALTYISAINTMFRVNDVSIPFAVHPPETSVSLAGTATTEPLGNNRYRITSGGTMQASYNFPPTYGYYYFGWIIGNPFNMVYYLGIMPMRTQLGSSGAYAATFGERTLVVNLEAMPAVPANNQAPVPPTITGPQTGAPSTSYTFSISGTDPDGDAITYDIDWTGDEASNFKSDQVASGQAITTPRSWSTIGPKTFNARTVDQYGVESTWTSYTVTISDPVVVSVELEVQDENGNWTASDTQLPPETDQITVRWSSVQASDCTATGFTMAGASAADRLANTQTAAAPASGSNVQLTVSCVNGDDTAQDSLNVAVTDFPAPQVIVKTKVNDGSYTTANKEIKSDDTLQLSWDSSDAETCVGTHLSESAGPTGETAVASPHEGSYTDYSVTCLNAAGVPASDTIRVTTLPQPTLVFEADIAGEKNADTQRYITAGQAASLHWTANYATSCTGSMFSTGGTAQSAAGGVPVTLSGTETTYTIDCSNAIGAVSGSITITAAQLDLVPENLTYRTSVEDDPTLFSSTTGSYNYVTVSFNGANRGHAVTPNTDPMYKIDFDKGNNGSQDVSSVNELGGNIAIGSSVSRQVQIANVPFGVNSVVIELNPNGLIAEKDLGNNIASLTTALPPPDPGISLTVDREIIRAGETTRLDWNTNTVYPMNCVVYWQGNQRQFNPSVDGNEDGDGDGATGYIDPTDPIEASTDFVLECTEPATNTVFKDTARVEVIGSLFEI